MTAIKCDLREESDMNSMFAEIKPKFGAVDVCINNAGLAHNSPLLSGENDEWREILEVFQLSVPLLTSCLHYLNS